MGGLAGAAGAGGPPGAAAAGGAASGKDAAGGKGTNLGVQRPGYGGGGQGGSQGRTVLTMEDLGMAVGEYGVNIKRGEFYR
jgi:transcription initiation factor TFIID subunit 10